MNILSIALPSPTDQSVNFLNQITGVVANFIDPSQYPVLQTTFAEMLRHFNEALLGFGLLIFAILLFVGTINTAADGQFLGRNWNSVWTPLRIVLGILFVVPLNTGLCVGQYIFLYVILVGVNIGTYVWNQVVDDIFNNYTLPAVPSYVQNYALQAIENQMIVSSMQAVTNVIYGSNGAPSNCPAGSPPNCQQIPFTTGGTETIGNLPASVISMITNQLSATPQVAAANQWPQICNALYTSPDIVYECINTINSVLVSGAFNGTGGATPGGDFNGNIIASIGNYQAGKYDGKIQVTGNYTYTFAVPGTAGGGAVNDPTPTVPQSLQTDINNQLNTFIPLNITGPVGSAAGQQCNPPTGGGQNPCSLAYIANHVIADAQTQIGAGLNCQPQLDPVTNLPIPNAPPVCPMSGIPQSPTQLSATTVDGAPILDADGNQVYDTNGNPEYTLINIPLQGSWWNAGASYLVLDNVFSSNLQQLIDAIEADTVALTGTGTLTGQLTATVPMQVDEMSADYMNAVGNPGSDSALALLPSCVPIATSPTSTLLADSPQVCGFGSRMSFPYQVVTFTGPDSSLADLAGMQDWASMIAPYNPTLNPLDPNFVTPANAAQATTLQNFYNQLLAVPAEFQAPLQMILFEAQNGTTSNASGCSANNGNCYATIYPYLQNILAVLAANGLLANNTTVLPINASLNAMFTELIGSADSNDPRIRSINSVMQDVYNLGVTNSSDIVSQQFSMIQQVRNAGIGMIVACVGSIEAVYEHFQAQTNNLLTTVSGETHGSNAEEAKALSVGAAALYGSAGAASFVSEKIGAGIGMLASASALSAQYLQTQVELSVATTTVMTLTNVSLQLMWLPLFLFIVTSLFTAGVQFALVIPFMPYIMFWAGQIAWLIGVLEALIAAPIVMLAFAHPGGNEHVGHAAPAMRFLIGIVFRPALMIIGMITGILLTYVLINYSADGFHIIADSIFSSLPAGDNTIMGIMSCLLLFTYTSFLMMAFTKCFSPIYVIPEKVVQWINGQADRAGEQEAQQFGSQVQQTAQQGGQAGGQSLTQGTQAQQQVGQQRSDLSTKQFSSSKAMVAGAKATEFGQAGASSAVQYGANRNQQN